MAFHKPSFLQGLKSGVLDHTLVNGIMTVAARHSPLIIRRYGAHGGSTAAAEHFASKTINSIMQSLDSPGLPEIQALCLLVIHEWGSRNAVRAYVYLGQAARMAQMYRIVQAHHLLAEPDRFLQDESLRRTLWLIYILDCFLTSSPGRHPALSSLDVNDVSLPCTDMNFHFGSPVFVRTLNGNPPSSATNGSTAVLGEVGEFGHIVLATKAWRNVVEMMTTTTLETFSEQQCSDLEKDIEAIRNSLPIHYADKPGQIHLHITMGSGYTYAMIHCLLNCGTIFVNRRRILQVVSAESFNLEAWKSSHANDQSVHQIFTASLSIIGSLVALESGADKDTILCFPIFMLFAAFTAGSTIAYLALKGLAPADVTESASSIVSDSMRFLHDGAESWPLCEPWKRHLAVMAKVLRDHDKSRNGSRDVQADQMKEDYHNHENGHNASPIKGDLTAQPDAMMESVEYDVSQGDIPHRPLAPADRPDSEPPIQRRPGIATINGGSVGAAVSAAGSPAPVTNGISKMDSPSLNSAAGAGAPLADSHSPMAADAEAPAGFDMTSIDLCNAFERQLLELDDLAAFMGGGV